MEHFFKQQFFLLFFLGMMISNGFSSPQDSSKSWIKSVETATSSEITFPKDSLDPNITFTQGLRLKTEGFTLTSSIKQTSTSATDMFSSIRTVFHSPDSILSKLAYSLAGKYSVSLKKFPLNLELMAGTLTQGKSTSRMKKPCFSYTSALSQPQTFTHGTGAAIPSTSTASTKFTLESTLESLGAAVALSPTAKATFFMPETEILVHGNGDFYTSIHKSFRTTTAQGERLTWSAALNAAYLNQCQEETTSWFQAKLPYAQKKYLSLEAEANFTSPWVTVSYAAGIQENPFGTPFHWIRTHDTFHLPFMTMNTAFYISDQNTIGASGTMTDRYLEAMANPQFIYIIEGNTIKAGFLYQYNLCFTKDMEREMHHIHQAKLDFSSQNSSLRWDSKTSLEYSSLSGDLDVSTKLSLALRGGTFKSTTSASFEGTFLTRDMSLASSTVSACQTVAFQQKQVAVSFPGMDPSKAAVSLTQQVNPSVSVEMDFISKAGSLDRVKVQTGISVKGRRKGMTWSVSGVINGTF